MTTSTTLTEHDEARALANRVLDRINGDPDDDLAILARQLLRADERLAKRALSLPPDLEGLIDELRGLLAKTFAGPWAIDPDDRDGMEWNNHIIDGTGLKTICFMSHDGTEENAEAKVAARLIADLPANITKLLDAITALVAENAFWGDPENHRRPTIEEARKRYGKHPTVAWRCGRNALEAGIGFALSPVELRFIEIFESERRATTLTQEQ